MSEQVVLIVATWYNFQSARFNLAVQLCKSIFSVGQNSEHRQVLNIAH